MNTTPVPLACRRCKAVMGTFTPAGHGLRVGAVVLFRRTTLTCAGCGHKHSFRPAADSRPRGQSIQPPASTPP